MMNANGGNWIQLTPEEQFALASEKFSRYTSAGHYNSKCRKWSRRLAHAALTLHPELREEGSLERYFVARLGRERGYRGVELTAFVDQAYESGLAKFAIEAGMASGPRHGGGIAKCVTHLRATDPAMLSGAGASIPKYLPPHKLPVRPHRTGDSEETGMTPLNEAKRIRLVRALIGMDSQTFAKRLGICAATLTSWEKGRSAPQGANRQALAELCQEHGTGFLPSGMPCRFPECFTFKPGEFTGWDSSFSPMAGCVRPT